MSHDDDLERKSAAEEYRAVMHDAYKMRKNAERSTILPWEDDDPFHIEAALEWVMDACESHIPAVTPHRKKPGTIERA